VLNALHPSAQGLPLGGAIINQIDSYYD